MAELLPVLRFGEFMLDRNTFALHRGGQPIRLQPKTFDVLAFLASNPGRIVREELVEAVWPGVIVTDNSLTRCIKDLRRALGDDAANPRFIETVSRRGYRFVVTPQPVEVLPAPEPARAPGSPVAPGLPGRKPATRSLVLVGAFALAVGISLVLVRDTAVRKGTDNFDALQAFELGTELMRKRPVDWAAQALRAFDRAIAHDAQFADAHAGRATALAATVVSVLKPAERAAEARASIATALALDPGSAIAHAAEGFLRLEEGDARGAERVLRRAIAADPEYGNAWNWLSGALLRQGRLDESLATLEKGVHADPLHPSLLVNIGIQYSNRGRYAQARASYARLHQLPYLTFQAEGAFVDIALMQGRLAEALEHGLKSEARSVDGPLQRMAKLKTALILARLGYPSESNARLQEVLADGMRWQRLYEVDPLLDTLGQAAQLEELARRLAPDRERPPAFRAMLARSRLLAGGQAGAIDSLADALAQSPRQVFGGWGDYAQRIDQELALAYGLQRHGREEEARSQLARILSDHREARAQGLGQTPDELRLLSQAQALAGDRESALGTLELAVEAGWNDALRAAHDPRWEGLRGEPRFEDAMARARQAIERERGQVKLALASLKLPK